MQGAKKRLDHLLSLMQNALSKGQDLELLGEDEEQGRRAAAPPAATACCCCFSPVLAACRAVAIHQT